VTCSSEGSSWSSWWVYGGRGTDDCGAGRVVPPGYCRLGHRNPLMHRTGLRSPSRGRLGYTWRPVGQGRTVHVAATPAGVVFEPVHLSRQTRRLRAGLRTGKTPRRSLGGNPDTAQIRHRTPTAPDWQRPRRMSHSWQRQGAGGLSTLRRSGSWCGLAPWQFSRAAQDRV